MLQHCLAMSTELAMIQHQHHAPPSPRLQVLLPGVQAESNALQTVTASLMESFLMAVSTVWHGFWAQALATVRFKDHNGMAAVTADDKH